MADLRFMSRLDFGTRHHRLVAVGRAGALGLLGRRCDNGSMIKTIHKLGPFVVVQGEVDGSTRCWVERGGARISGYSDAEEAKEYASLLYDEYMDDADVDTGE